MIIPYAAVLRRLHACALILLCFVPSALAHDFGSMKVAATFSPDGGYSIDITIFPEHLPIASRPDAGGRSPADYALAFAASARIIFDGVPVSPQVEALLEPANPLDPAAPPPPSIRLTGVVPPGSRIMSWSHLWPTDDYFFCAQAAGAPEPASQWVRAAAPTDPFPLSSTTAPPTTAAVVAQYLALGFTHIVPEGLDHILFVLSLFLLSLSPRAMLMQVTAFTLAHSVTLALSMYNVVRLPPSVVEPLIAISIVCVAVENLFIRKARPHRVALVFLFGLLHGLGFAGVLTEIGLPRSRMVPALISFNIGVECGQLAIILAAYLAVGVWFGRKSWYRSAITIPASLAIALVGAYWTVERIIG